MSDNLFADTTLEVSEFVALVNQTLEYAYPTVTIRGELANFKISKNKWIYFDLKDEASSVRFFGTVHMLSGPVEDGMLLRVRGIPKLHPQYGFSITVIHMRPEGEGTLRRAADLLKAKLQAEGLFDDERKRPLPYPPEHIGLITSTESAAYADFIKILNARWQGITVDCVDIQVQGEVAPDQIVAAIEHLNSSSIFPDVLVLTRGGGSTEDLYAFDTEQVTRAIAASRIPTLVAIGHETDTSLAELAADRRASTPSNAAELLVPDKREVSRQLKDVSVRFHELATSNFDTLRRTLDQYNADLEQLLKTVLGRTSDQLLAYGQLLEALNPKRILKRGYSIVRQSNKVIVRRKSEVKSGDIVDIEVSDGHMDATID
jgi:exodeoxyribonuclease VII large subunit